MAIAIATYVQRLIVPYDHNRNRQVDRNAKRPEDEREQRIELIDRIRFSTLSSAKLWERADANRDGHVTSQELESVVRGFDKDGDGKLDGRERRAFERAFPEDETFVIEVPKPNPFPPRRK